MSGILDRFLTETCTIWPVQSGVNEFGQLVYGSPVQKSCAYKKGGKLVRDQNGNEFAPATTFVMRFEPALGSLIAVGSHTGSPSSVLTEKIRVVQKSTELRGQTDVMVMTS